MSDLDRPLSPIFKMPLTPKNQYRITPPSGHTLKIAHISDTHLGLNERTVYVPDGHGKSEPVKKEVNSFKKFLGLIQTIQALDPDIIIHTGDIMDKELFGDLERYQNFKSNLLNLRKDRLFLYLRGNHDKKFGGKYIRDLLHKWDVLSIEDAAPISIANNQIMLYGTDYQNVKSTGHFNVDQIDIPPEVISIGAFHQSIQNISRSFNANVDLSDLSPPDKITPEYYDLVLLGHMHTSHIDRTESCAVIDGGSAFGLDTASTVGLLTFSKGASHYQKFPLWLNEAQPS